MTTIEQNDAPRARMTGAVALATGIAGIVLLALHPEPAAKDFAGRLAGEAATRGMDAIVHGGFVLVLAVQIVCYAVFSQRIGRGRVPALAAIVFFAIGAAFFSAALVLDGLAAPAIAVRYLAKPDKIEFARALYVLIGTLVSLLQPLGIAFQGAAVALWGWALAGHGARAGGVFALLLGVALIGAAGAAVVAGNPLPLMAAIVGTAVWAVAVGLGMMRRR
jgi:hypothetical protein